RCDCGCAGDTKRVLDCRSQSMTSVHKLLVATSSTVPEFCLPFKDLCSDFLYLSYRQFWWQCCDALLHPIDTKNLVEPGRCHSLHFEDLQTAFLFVRTDHLIVANDLRIDLLSIRYIRFQFRISHITFPLT